MATGGLKSIMDSEGWITITKEKFKEQELGKIQENKCMNCKEVGHKHWQCSKQDICRICKNEGHIAKDCPNAKSCKYCNKKGHPENRCYNKREAIGESRAAKDRGTEGDAQEVHSQDNRGDWHQWAPQKALREAMAKQNKRTVVTVTTECEGEKREPTKKEIKRVLNHRKIDTKKVVGVINKIDKAEVFFADEETAESFLFEHALKAGPNIWATSARIGSNNIKKVIFKKVSWNINDDTILKYASIWGTPQQGKDGRYITYEKESVEEGGTKWLTGNRIVMMMIKEHIPRKNIIQGCMVAVDYPGQQECFKCKDTPDKCPGRGKAKDCNLAQSFWKDKLRERLKGMKYDLSEMEVGGGEITEENEDARGINHLTDEQDENEVEKLEENEHLEEIKILGMINIEKEVLWELIKDRMRKAAEAAEEIGNEEMEEALENKNEEFENASVEFNPFSQRIGWGNMSIKSEDEDLLKAIWTGISLMRDALEIKLIPKYQNSQITPTKKKVDDEITPMEKLQIDIKAIKAGLKKKEDEKKKKEDDEKKKKEDDEKKKQEGETTPDPTGDTQNPQNGGARNKTDVIQLQQRSPKKNGEDVNESEHSGEEEGKDLRQVVTMEVDQNTSNLDENGEDEGATKASDTPRHSRLKEKGSRCGKCAFCKQQCGNCVECNEMLNPTQRRKACRNRGLCKSPRTLSKTPSQTRKADQLMDEGVRKKIDRLDKLEKEGTDTILPLVAVPGTG